MPHFFSKMLKPLQTLGLLDKHTYLFIKKQILHPGNADKNLQDLDLIQKLCVPGSGNQQIAQSERNQHLYIYWEP